MSTSSAYTLDVTQLAPQQKHATIFARYDQLQPGETLTIHNDHDPKPLYYQLLRERGNSFQWQYQQKGPEWWIVSISKRMQQHAPTVGEIAASNMHKLETLKKYGIDYCCGGKLTLAEACAEKGLNLPEIEAALLEAGTGNVVDPIAYNDWAPGFLADYIINTHHRYVRRLLPELNEYAAKVAQVHGAEQPELVQVQQLVKAIDAALSTHLVKEEAVLFPYIKTLAAAKQGEVPQQQAVFESIQQPINMMEMEHETAGEYLLQIRTLTDHYQLPANACNSHTMLYRLLAAFEEDLHLYVHLENNILFPKAIQLEKDLGVHQ